MKKNLLFVMPSLTAGGGEKSLVNLLSQIDYKKYNVDLLIFHDEGIFLELLPHEVNIVKLPPRYWNFRKGIIRSVLTLFFSGYFDLSFARVMFMLKNRRIKVTSLAEQYSWKYYRKAFDNLEKEYDAAIGFLEKSSIYFVVEKVKAKRKVGWIHTNYSNSGMDPAFDQPYFEILDNIVTVSEECANSLKKHFSKLTSKINVIYNIVSPKIIKELSISTVADDTLFIHGFLNIVTVARLSYEKGIDMAINSCKILVEKGYKVNWFVIGSGNEKEKLEKLIHDYNLEKNFILLGVKQNPYPYIKKADLYVQPSRYEGKSIALDEAKILNKPIVVTNFDTAEDQINHEFNGIIVNSTDLGIAAGIEKLINDPVLKSNLSVSLSKEKLGTEGEINKLYKII